MADSISVVFNEGHIMKTELLQGYDVLVVGSGAAGFNAACHVAKEGCKTVALVTEGVRLGTSRNTGSDKQTYYKLGLSGDSPDSVRKMAEDLYTGGCVDGDNALCEAALSARCFLNLCELGVAFPVNRYGEYIGYQTDHDTFARATSAGPLTSKFMTEALEQQAAHLNIPVLDGLQVVELVKNESGICGVICIEINSGDLSFIPCGNVILATGGPAGVYSDSVYPICHTGSSSLALDCGAHFQNMTYWQYGLSSVTPRWNVSGTYMQVLPRFVSVDANGTQHEFLLDYFNDPYDALSAVFLKGYQWPFDSNKVPDGSSVIDLAVYNECVSKNRKVYLDYTKNPFGFFELDYSKLSADAQTYLQNANACFGTPIARLQLMNQPAIDLYKNKGVDLTKQMLQIALCAQHHNGGISVDMWWHTCVDGLFACGECAGTHGVARPGGSALNAGQVGALRAALNASHNDRIAPKPDVSFVNDCLGKHRSFT
jgi:succinate dehydrogenase/fumarate reductase flavoprotein subunit